MMDLPPRGTLTLGRGEGVDVRVDHGSVSRTHAALHLGETIALEDLGSSNGTFVDGQRLGQGQRVGLRPGALVEVGAVLVVVQSAEESRRAMAASHAAHATKSASGEGSPVVVDAEMARVYELLDVVARSSLSVVLMGETGVGKEVLASRIHESSPRSGAPFSKINCAALVESLLEAELFGYERGAFTGAHQAKPGLVESVHGGTLFLDEVGELPLTTQAKLLRVLESGEVTRVGSLKPRSIDVRFISATNRDLRDWVAQGRFREDLFFRLDGISVYVPPLRERTSEIPELAARFIEAAAKQHGTRKLAISRDAMDALIAYPWPGNVRELRNVIGRSVLLARGPALEAADLRFEPAGTRSRPPSYAAPPRPTDAYATTPAAPTLPPPPVAPSGVGPHRPKIDDGERQRVLDALDRCGGNQTRAAKMLGISRRTMLNRLDALGIPRPRKSDDEPEGDD
ncbi:MAG: sigma 54-interacting transcriptional regulator [Myxococcales bacterium]|nr:sigma 54-interacting transcriptional regulator [Myxococcales bacterium]